MAVVVVSLVALHGIEYLFPAVILCGLLQITVGLLRMGKLIRLVPHSVMLGFVNGLAIVIGLAQIGSFKTLGSDGTMTFLQGPSMSVAEPERCSNHMSAVKTMVLKGYCLCDDRGSAYKFRSKHVV